MLINDLVYAAPDLPATVADVEERPGVPTQLGGGHIGLGGHNALLALGPQTNLQIVVPDPGQPERPRLVPSAPAAATAGWLAGCLPATASTRLSPDVSGYPAQGARPSRPDRGDQRPLPA